MTNVSYRDLLSAPHDVLKKPEHLKTPTSAQIRAVLAMLDAEANDTKELAVGCRAG